MSSWGGVAPAPRCLTLTAAPINLPEMALRKHYAEIGGGGEGVYIYSLCVCICVSMCVCVSVRERLDSFFSKVCVTQLLSKPCNLRN